MTRPRIGIDVDDTLVFGDEVSEVAMETVKDLMDHYTVIIFTGRTDIPDEVWDVIGVGECRKPMIEDYYTGGREWKIDKHRAWKFDVIIDDDPAVLKIVDVPVRLMISDESDWESLREFLLGNGSKTVEQMRNQKADIQFTTS